MDHSLSLLDDAYILCESRQLMLESTGRTRRVDEWPVYSDEPV